MDYFADLIGQDRAVKLLRQAMALNQVAPAYLFYGAAGIGRSIAARNFAELLLTANLPLARQLRTIKKLNLAIIPTCCGCSLLIFIKEN